MISAKEARNITEANNPNLLERVLDDVSAQIAKAAKAGQNSLRTYGLDGCFGNSELYNGNTPLVDKAIKALKTHGYDAQIKCEMRQFVDIYLEVKW